jgi:cytochrome oxidase Cu insertion factor (SCO1/SenC/PrrC family)
VRGAARAWLLALGCIGLPQAPAAHESADTSAEAKPRFEAPPPGSYELPPIDRVAEHTLLGSDGNPTSLLGLAADEVALVSFVYLSCGEACPLATATLHRIDRELAGDPALAAHVTLVTVSFDPERDTPERMRQLEASSKPRGRWRFLTAANRAALEPVLADFGQDAVWIPDADTPEAPDRLRHVLKVFLVDDERQVRNVYSTGLMDIRLVMNDVRTVLGESEAD